MRLNAAQELAVRQWAQADGFWRTPAVVDINLRAFARVMLDLDDARARVIELERLCDALRTPMRPAQDEDLG